MQEALRRQLRRQVHHPLELRSYGDEAMSPRLRPAPSRSSFQAEVAVLLRRHEVALVVIVLLDLKVWEEGGERCGASSPVPTGSRHDPRPPSLSLFLGSGRRRAMNPPREGRGKRHAWRGGHGALRQ